MKNVVGPTALPPKDEVTVTRITDGAPQSKPAITMYVRRDETSDPKVKARTIFLRPIPDKVSMDDLLEIGFAYDGDTVSLSVDPYTTASFGKGPWPLGTRGKPDIRSIGDNASMLEPWTLTKALNSVQTALVEWLRGLGYEVKIA